MHRKGYTLFVLIMLLSQVVLHGEVFNEVVICVLQAWPLEPMASAAQPWGRVLEWSKTRRCEGQTKEVKAKHLQPQDTDHTSKTMKRWSRCVCARREGGCKGMKCVASNQDLHNKERRRKELAPNENQDQCAKIGLVFHERKESEVAPISLSRIWIQKSHMCALRKWLLGKVTFTCCCSQCSCHFPPWQLPHA